MISKKYSHLRLKIVESDYVYVLFDSVDQMENAIRLLNQKSADYISCSFRGERSLICKEHDRTFECLKFQSGWAGFKIEGEMPFGSVQGLISTISSALARDGIGVCVISTYLTDLFLVKNSNLEKVKTILSTEGWKFEE